MLSEVNCCNRHPDDVDEETGDPEVQQIYNAIIEGSELRKDEGTGDEGNGVYEDDAKHKNSGKKYRKIKAFKLLHTYLARYMNDSDSAVDRLGRFRRKSEDSLDTLLHTSALLSKDWRLVELLVTACPNLISIERTKSYAGQTALHITVGKGKIKSTQAILENTRQADREILFKTKATGSKFRNNIMMGEIPLSVAVLTFNMDMVELLLKHGARLEEVNSKNDTIVHTLIKYAQIHPDESQEVITMLHYINKEIFQNYTEFRWNNEDNNNESLDKKLDSNQPERKKNFMNSVNDEKKTLKNRVLKKLTDSRVDKMWFKENNDRMTPLKLTVSMGLIDIFTALMKMRNIFYFPSNYDGSFDSSFYDITEIDHVAQFRYTKQNERRLLQDKTRLDQGLTKIQLYFKRPDSVIENLSNLEWKNAQPFVNTEIIKMIISKRWRKYKYSYYIFLTLHIFVMILFATSAYYRKHVSNSEECKKSATNCRKEKLYTDIVPWILFGYSLIMFISEFYRWILLRQKWRPDKHHNNTWYRVGLVVFALGLLIDCILYSNDIDSNDNFVMVLISGCFFLPFFFKGVEKLSVYTVLFQKVIMGDLLRFGVIICVEYAAFSYSMYIVLRGNSDNIKEFSTFENSTLTMFGHMLGLKSLEFLDTVDSNMQRLVAVIYVLFILTTYILLINSLIAMMSGTCMDIFQDRKSLAILQKSSVILFLDGLLFVRYSIRDKPRITCPVRKDRYYLEIRKEQMGKLMNENQKNEALTLKSLRSELWKRNKKNDRDIMTSDMATSTEIILVDKTTSTETVHKADKSTWTDSSQVDVIPIHARQAWVDVYQHELTN